MPSDPTVHDDRVPTAEPTLDPFVFDVTHRRGEPVRRDTPGFHSSSLMSVPTRKQMLPAQ